MYHYVFAGATLEIITDRSQEGAQFVRGFGGIGGKSHLCMWLRCWIQDSKVMGSIPTPGMIKF